MTQSANLQLARDSPLQPSSRLWGSLMTMLLPQQHQCSLRKPKFPSNKKMMQNPRDGGSYKYPNINPGYTPRGLYHSCLAVHHPLLPPGTLDSKCTRWSAASSKESSEAKGTHSRVYTGMVLTHTHFAPSSLNKQVDFLQKSRAVYHNKECNSKQASTSAFDDKILFYFFKGNGRY